MRNSIPITSVMLLLLTGVAATTMADELTMTIEKDLAALGYSTGPVDGEETMETVIAISKYQAENNLEVTGEVTPQLAGILSSNASGGSTGAPAVTPEALKAAQQACLQEKIAAAQASQKKKRGFGRLFRVVTRTASRSGNYDLAKTADDFYYAGATADDLSAAAKDLGLTEDEVAACQNPG